MLIGVRQRGQPHPWLCTSLAHDSQKRWWPYAPARCVYHMRCHETHLAEVNSCCVSWYGHWRTGVVIILMLRLNGSHLASSLSRRHTARRNCSRVYAWLSNLRKHIFMRVSLVRYGNAFLGASDGQTAVVHFVGTRLTEALMTVRLRHQRDACITRCHETPRRSQQLRQLLGVVGAPASSSFWCCVLSSAGPRCRHRRPRLNGSHLASSLSRRHGYI